MSDLDDLRAEYLEAVSELFHESTRDQAFKDDKVLHDAAIAAQSILGRIEQRLLIDTSKLDPQERALIDAELLKAEDEFKDAVEVLLGRTISRDNDQIISAAETVAAIKRRFDKSRQAPAVKS